MGYVKNCMVPKRSKFKAGFTAQRQTRPHFPLESVTDHFELETSRAYHFVEYTEFYWDYVVGMVIGPKISSRLLIWSNRMWKAHENYKERIFLPIRVIAIALKLLHCGMNKSLTPRRMLSRRGTYRTAKGTLLRRLSSMGPYNIELN